MYTEVFEWIYYFKRLIMKYNIAFLYVYPLQNWLFLFYLYLFSYPIGYRNAVCLRLLSVVPQLFQQKLPRFLAEHKHTQFKTINITDAVYISFYVL